MSSRLTNQNSGAYNPSLNPNYPLSVWEDLPKGKHFFARSV